MRTVPRYRKLFTATTALCALGSSLFLTAPRQACAQAAGLVISQIYGGGGNAGATYNRDFVELFNGTGSAIDLTGYTLQYASATGNFQTANSQVTTLSGTIQSGGFFLIGLSPQNPSSGTALPVSVDVSGNANLSATAGKLALANNTTLVTYTAGSSMFSSNVVDFVGYGTTANAFEGALAPAPSNTTSIIRASYTASGASSPSNLQDSNNNGADFMASVAGSFVPRNSASMFGNGFIPSGAANTPEPGSLVLGLGTLPMLGLVGLRRRNRTKKTSQLIAV